MKLNRTILAALAILPAAAADAATLSMTVIINGPVAASITCPITATFTAPVAAGTVICPITVSPSNWSGTLGLSGANASAFAITSGSNLVVGGTPITSAGNLSVTINAAP